MKRPNNLGTWMKSRSAKRIPSRSLGDFDPKISWYVWDGNVSQNPLGTTVEIFNTEGDMFCSEPLLEGTQGHCYACWPKYTKSVRPTGSIGLTASRTPGQTSLDQWGSYYQIGPVPDDTPGPGKKRTFLTANQLKNLPMVGCDKLLALPVSDTSYGVVGGMLCDRLTLETDKVGDMFDAARVAAANAQTDDDIKAAQKQFEAASDALDKLEQIEKYNATSMAWPVEKPAFSCGGISFVLDGYRETTRKAVSDLVSAKKFKSQIDDNALRKAAVNKEVAALQNQSWFERGGISTEQLPDAQPIPPPDSPDRQAYDDAAQRWQDILNDLNKRANDLASRCGGMEPNSIVTQAQALLDDISSAISKGGQWSTSPGVVSSDNLISMVTGILNNAKNGIPCSKSDACPALAIAKYGEFLGRMPGMAQVACASSCFDSPVGVGCPLGENWKWYVGGAVAILGAIVLWSLSKKLGLRRNNKRRRK